jgi:hypothetical protein
MATAMFTEMMDNLQHSTRLIPESLSFTMNCSRENLTARAFYISDNLFQFQGDRPDKGGSKHL